MDSNMDEKSLIFQTLKLEVMIWKTVISQFHNELSKNYILGRQRCEQKFRKTKQWIKFHYAKFETKIEVWRIIELKKKNKK